MCIVVLAHSPHFDDRTTYTSAAAAMGFSVMRAVLSEFVSVIVPCMVAGAVVFYMFYMYCWRCSLFVLGCVPCLVAGAIVCFFVILYGCVCSRNVSLYDRMLNATSLNIWKVKG